MDNALAQCISPSSITLHWSGKQSCLHQHTAAAAAAAAGSSMYFCCPCSSRGSTSCRIHCHSELMAAAHMLPAAAAAAAIALPSTLNNACKDRAASLQVICCSCAVSQVICCSCAVRSSVAHVLSSCSIPGAKACHNLPALQSNANMCNILLTAGPAAASHLHLKARYDRQDFVPATFRWGCQQQQLCGVMWCLCWMAEVATTMYFHLIGLQSSAAHGPSPYRAGIFIIIKLTDQAIASTPSASRSPEAEEAGIL
jgi:hypothetical protein